MHMNSIRIIVWGIMQNNVRNNFHIKFKTVLHFTTATVKNKEEILKNKKDLKFWNAP